MRDQLNIRQWLAGLLACIFAFAIIPKTFLHDIITHHNHSSPKKTDTHDAINQAGLSCQYDNLVATEAFLGGGERLVLQVPVKYVQPWFVPVYEPFLIFHTSYPTLRGPPFAQA